MWWKQRGARELRRILMEEWDPIHVREVAEAADEYDGYLGPVASRLREEASAEEIASYLTEVEEVRMGLGRSPAARKRNRVLAVQLRAWYAEEMAASEGQVSRLRQCSAMTPDGGTRTAVRLPLFVAWTLASAYVRG